MPEPFSGNDRGRVATGIAPSLAAAATFGVLAPATKGALAHVGPIRGAALAYLAAGLVALLALLVDSAAGLPRRGRSVSWRVAGSSWLGGMLLAGACIAWAGDNTLARDASDLDPLLVVSIKGLAAGTVLSLGSAGSPWPLEARGWGLVALAGGVGVGVSLVLELLALRRIGAALNAGLFATGPAFGFVWSLVFLGEHSTVSSWVALAWCVIGAVALLVDRHEHEHVHEPLRHTHRHHHLDGHHTHSHGPGSDPATEHVHEHHHESLRHSHAHVHDEHHRHRHQSDREQVSIWVSITLGL